MKRSALLLIFALAGAAAADYLPLPGGEFNSVLPADGVNARAQIAPFLLRSRPVSNADFRDFVLSHPAWQRGRVPAVLADGDYLSMWKSATDIGSLGADAPVTRVSWHAAVAYCDSEAARLPRWVEWEFAAAADEHRADARDDPAWLSRILNWYAHPATLPLPVIGRTPANFYGLQDMHGLVWEWVEDAGSLLVSGDGREQGGQKQLDYCGGAAATLGDRQNYAVLMRLALLAAMEGNQAGPNLGFRCARDVVNK